MDGRERKDVRPGLTVDIVLKQDQRTGRLKRGLVQVVLTNFYTIPFCRRCGKTGVYGSGVTSVKSTSASALIASLRRASPQRRTASTVRAAKFP